VTTLILFQLALCILASALFSGTETGLYSLSRLRVEARARAGNRTARLIQLLQRDEAGLLITILIGNNLMLEIATHLAENLAALGGVPPNARELVLALCLTPVLFFFGELLPKDLFRRRPHRLVAFVAPAIALARIAFLPLALPLRGLAWVIEHAAGLRHADVTSVLGHEVVYELLAESTRTGSIEPHAERLARNVLKLRSTKIDAVMIRWRDVSVIAEQAGDVACRETVARSNFSRLPVVAADGTARGYVHQTEVLATPDEPVLARRRDLLALPPDLTVDRALARLRTAGHRAALVGTSAAPLGWLTLKDLVEEISGELAGW